MKRKLITSLIAIIAVASNLWSADFTFEYEGQTLNYKTIKSDTEVEVTVNTEISGTVIIPATVNDGTNDYNVTRIGIIAFRFCSELTSVTIPNSVTSIGHGAFDNCSGLTSIEIPDGVTKIEPSAFSNCTNLASINIPDGLTSIGTSAFLSCTSLTTINLPASLTEIAGRMFDYSGLTSITIPAGVASIGPAAFQFSTDLKTITMLGSTPPTLGDKAFESVNPDKIIVPAGAESAYKAAWPAFASIITSTAQPITYNSADVDALRAFMIQHQPNGGTQNASKVLEQGYMGSINLEGDSWVSKVIGLTWSGNNDDKRITAIDWSNKDIGGELNLTTFSELVSIDISNAKLTSLIASTTSNLTTVNATGQSQSLATQEATAGTLTITNPIRYNNAPIAGITGASNDNSTITLTDLAGESGNATFNFSATIGSIGTFSGTVTQPWTAAPTPTITLYHETDVAALRAFLSQPAQGGQRNIDKVYNGTAPASLDGQDWVSNLSGLEWTEDAEHKRLLTVMWNEKNLAGALDLSPCTELTHIYCEVNSINSLILTNNAKLLHLHCSSNNLNTLDLSACTALSILNCSTNQINSLNISKNTSLIYLNCNSNQLTALDVSKNTALTTLEYSSNGVNTLDLTKNTALTALNLNANNLSSLDLSKNTALTTVSISNSNLTSLNISENKELSHLECDNNEITSLNLTNNTKLTRLVCNNNNLKTLDVSQSAMMMYLYCHENQLTSLNIGNITNLSYINASNQTVALESKAAFNGNLTINNPITYNNAPVTGIAEAIDGDTKIAWTSLSGDNGNATFGFSVNIPYGGGSQHGTFSGTVTQPWTKTDAPAPTITYNAGDIDALRAFLLQSPLEDIFNYKNINYVWTGGGTPPSTLDGSDWIAGVAGLTWSGSDDNKRLTEINWSGRPIGGDFNLAACSELTKLDLSFCSLTTLNVSQNSKLIYFSVVSSNLTSLDISNNNALEELYCQINKLTSLNVSQNAKLVKLHVRNNNLISLDVSNNNALKELDCSNNCLTSFNLGNTASQRRVVANDQIISLSPVTVTDETLSIANTITYNGAEVTNISGANLTYSNGTVTWTNLSGENGTVTYNFGTTMPVGVTGTPFSGEITQPWTKNTAPALPTYTITFDTQEGTTVAPLENVEEGETIAAPTAPTRDGYVFEGWFKEAACTNAWSFDNDQVTNHTTLYAKWSQTTTVTGITVSFDSQGGSYIGILQNVPSGTTITAPDAPTRPGHTFAGWFREPNCTTAWLFDTDIVTGNVTLYAKWTASTPTEPVPVYRVTFNTHNGSSIAPYTNVEEGTTIARPASPTLDGHTFDGWYLDDEYTTLWLFTTDLVLSDITLHAKWNLIPDNQIIIAEERLPVGSAGKGHIDLSLRLPANATVTGTFEAHFPAGYTLDESATTLVQSLATSFNLKFTDLNNNVWQIEIEPNGLRSSSPTVITKIMEIAYTVATSVPIGEYNVVLKNFNLTISDTETVRETELTVKTAVTSPITDTARPGAGTVRAYSTANQIHVDTPAAETIIVYSITGTQLHVTNKAPGTIRIPFPHQGIVILKGSSGWTRKIIVNS